MRAVLDATRKKFGAINGVIHAAGIVRPGLAQTKSRATLDGGKTARVAIPCARYLAENFLFSTSLVEIGFHG